MGKKAQHELDLKALIPEFVGDGDPGKLRDYMLSNSNLPGRRANLELAEAFGDVVESQVESERARLWELCKGWTEISAQEAPVNAPEEFLPFCGAIGMGAIGSIASRYFEPAVGRLRNLANDPRWRMREGVRFGLQRMMERRSAPTLNNIEAWVNTGSWLEMRAAAASLAEPAILKKKEIAVTALRVHEMIFKRIQEAADRQAEGFKTLRKGLGYTLSVVVSAMPIEGFGLMGQLVATQDQDMLWIVKQNLKKKRLAEYYPQEVKALKLSIVMCQPDVDG